MSPRTSTIKEVKKDEPGVVPTDEAIWNMGETPEPWHNGPLYKKLSQILAEMTSVPKKGYNSFHKYHYVTEGDLSEVIRPLLAKHGIAITFGISGEPVFHGDITQVICEIRIGDSEGHEIVTRVPGWGQDKGDKGGYKAMTGAVKYWLYKTFLVSTGDDPEREDRETSHASTPAPQPTSQGPMCPTCGSSMHSESKVSKAGKPFVVWVCDNPGCKNEKGYRTSMFDTEWQRQKSAQEAPPPPDDDMIPF